MPSASKLTTNLKTAVIGEGDDPLKVTFKPGSISPKALRGLTNSDKPADEHEALDTLDKMVDLIVTSVTEWNLTATDDSPVVPLTFDAVSDLGVEVLMLVVEGITGAMAPGEANGTPSSAPTNEPSSVEA